MNAEYLAALIEAGGTVLAALIGAGGAVAIVLHRKVVIDLSGHRGFRWMKARM